MASRIARDLVIVVPFTVEHESHSRSPFALIAILVSKPIGIRKLLASWCNEAPSSIAIWIDTSILLLR
jgi:hypothetical protein